MVLKTSITYSDTVMITAFPGTESEGKLSCILINRTCVLMGHNLSNNTCVRTLAHVHAHMHIVNAATAKKIYKWPIGT